MHSNAGSDAFKVTGKRITVAGSDAKRRALFTTERWQTPPMSSIATADHPDFLERVRQELTCEKQRHAKGSQVMHFGDRMHLGDIVAAYYYRRVQTSLFIHVHLLGYCKQRADNQCRFNLPREETTTTQRLNEDTDRVDSPCRYLPDDRNVKVHILPLVVRTLACLLYTSPSPRDS